MHIYILIKVVINSLRATCMNELIKRVFILATCIMFVCVFSTAQMFCMLEKSFGKNSRTVHMAKISTILSSNLILLSSSQLRATFVDCFCVDIMGSRTDDTYRNRVCLGIWCLTVQLKVVTSTDKVLPYSNVSFFASV